MLGKRIEICQKNDSVSESYAPGIVRSYSPTTNRWLVAYDDPLREASWENLFSPSLKFKLLDEHKNLYDLNTADLAPFTFGMQSKRDGRQNICKTHCMNCIKPADKSVCLQCRCCSMLFHPKCLDPPMSRQELLTIKENEWVCDKCTECTGCNSFDIVFGSVSFSPHPKSLSVKDPVLCSGELYLMFV